MAKEQLTKTTGKEKLATEKQSTVTVKSTPVKQLSEQELIDIFQECTDPEIGIDIYTLGLIRKYQLKPNYVYIEMTLTSPLCPYGGMMIEEIKEKIQAKGITNVKIELTFDPPWEPPEGLRDSLGV